MTNTFFQKRSFRFTILLFFCISLFQSIATQHQKPCTTIFVHGLGSKPTSLRYYQRYEIILDEAYAFKLYDKLSLVSLGQHHELNNLNTAIEKIKTEKPGENIILRGVSMGASTITNYLGSFCPLTPEIKGAILESPYADVIDVPNDMIQKSTFLYILDKICPYLKKIAVYYAHKNHNLSGIQPIKAASSIPHHIPILLIATKKDTIVPAHSTSRIYNELVKSGHTKAHILIIDHGKHANICWHNKCGELVRNVEHAFRKKYELGNYNETYASDGQAAFAQTQPLI